jgi:hypothetical protein
VSSLRFSPIDTEIDAPDSSEGEPGQAYNETEDECILMQLTKTDQINHSDLSGCMPIASKRGFQYVLISVWRGYVHFEWQRGRTSAEYATSYGATLDYFKDKGNVKINGAAFGQ